MKYPFNNDWTFAKYSLEATEDELLSGSSSHCLTPEASVDIPHDWLIGQVNNLYEDSIGCYRKHFKHYSSRALSNSRFFSCLNIFFCMVLK